MPREPLDCIVNHLNMLPLNILYDLQVESCGDNRHASDSQSTVKYRAMINLNIEFDILIT